MCTAEYYLALKRENIETIWMNPGDIMNSVMKVTDTASFPLYVQLKSCCYHKRMVVSRGWGQKKQGSEK